MFIGAERFHHHQAFQVTNTFSDDARYLAAAITTSAITGPSFSKLMADAITAAVAAAGISSPSDRFMASVLFTAEVCFGGGDSIAAAANEGVATWLDIA